MSVRVYTIRCDNCHPFQLWVGRGVPSGSIQRGEDWTPWDFRPAGTNADQPGFSAAMRRTAAKYLRGSRRLAREGRAEILRHLIG